MVLYFGNMLSRHGYTKTAIENLKPKFINLFNISFYSHISNPFLRLLDMIFSFIIKRKSTRLILIDTYSSKAFYYSFCIGILSHIFNVPYIPILHGGDLLSRLKRSSGMFRILLNNAYLIISPSRYLIDSLQSLDKQIIYIPNFIEINQYPYRYRKKIKPHLLWVRSFDKIYNPKMAIYVVNELLKKYPTAILTMVGPEKDGTQEICKKLSEKLGINKNINFTGILNREDWISLSEKSDIFINTTHIDNLPVSIIEAMALGFPIISTNVGGINYLLKDRQNGLLVDDNDVHGMVERIYNLIEDQELSSQLSNNARKTSMEYAWNKIEPKWTKIIRDNKIHG